MTDYSQLLPVNDKISPNTDYSNSPALFELADRNKIKFNKHKAGVQTVNFMINTV